MKDPEISDSYKSAEISLARVSELQELLLNFQRVDRAIYLLDQDGEFRGRKENDSEHSYSLAMLAMYLQPRIAPDLDTDKCMRYALVHDFAEVYAGDVSQWANIEERQAKVEKEEAAVEHGKEKWPDFPELWGTIEQYERQEDPESKFIKALDKLQAVLMLTVNQGIFWKAEGKTQAMHKALYHKVRPTVAESPEVLELYDQLEAFLDDHPEYFFQPED